MVKLHQSTGKPVDVKKIVKEYIINKMKKNNPQPSQKGSEDSR